MMTAMVARLHSQTTLDGAVHTILDDVVGLLGARFGDLQFALDDHTLILVDQHGFSRSFLLGLRKLTPEAPTVCMRAFLGRAPMTVADVVHDPPFSKYLDLARSIGFKAVHSQPLHGGPDAPIGVVSALFARAHSPTREELRGLAEYSQLAAGHLRGLLKGKDVNAEAERLFLSMLDKVPARIELPTAPVLTINGKACGLMPSAGCRQPS